MPTRQRYIRARQELEGLCVTARCPHEASEVVVVRLGPQDRSVGMCSRHALPYRSRAFH